jgi:hypothetical protein
MKVMTTRTALGIQVLTTEVASVLIFGLIGGYWRAGLVAPYTIVVLPFDIFLDPAYPLTRQLIPVAVLGAVLFSLFLLSFLGSLRRWVGHVALAAFNVLSVLVTVGGR